MATEKHHAFELPIGADHFFLDLYLEPAFTEALYREGLGFSDFEVIEPPFRDGTGVVRRALRLNPPTRAPRIVQRALGGTQQYVERGALDPTGRVWRYEVVPTTMSSRIQVHGVVLAEPLGPDRCRASFEARFEVSLFGVGRAVERFMAAQFESHLARQEPFMRAWLDGLSGAGG